MTLQGGNCTKDNITFRKCIFRGLMAAFDDLKTTHHRQYHE